MIQGSQPQDVNALTSSLIQIFQGQGDTLDSLLSKTSSFSNTLANNDQVIQQLIDNLNSVVGTLAKDGKKFDGTVDRLEQLISGLSQDRDPLGTRSDAAGQRNRLARQACSPRRGRRSRAPSTRSIDWRPLLDDHQIVLDRGLRRRPTTTASWRGWAPTAAGSCTTSADFAIRVTDLQGRTAHFPMIKQEGGRCAEP